MTHEEIEANHYARLNAYRNSREYHIYRDEIGDGLRNPDEFPSLFGTRWEINEELFMHFLEVLPPLEMDRTSFTFAEFTFGNITTRYSQEGDRYYCEFVEREAA